MIKILAAIPLFNKSATIVRAVTSVLAQTVTCDILVIDDGSTDDSINKLSDIVFNRLKIIEQENHGVSDTRNKAIDYGIKHGYDAIAFLDADDYWLPDHLHNLINLLSALPAADIVAANYKYHQCNNRFTQTTFSGGIIQAQILDPYFDFTHLSSPLYSSNMLLKISENTLRYNSTITHGEDTDFNIRVGMQNKIAFTDKVTAIIELDSSNRSNSVDVSNRTYLDLDQYEKFTDDYSGLKKYLDLNRFALAVEYLSAGSKEKAVELKSKIKFSNLTVKQQLILNSSPAQIRAMRQIQGFLNRRGIRWRTGA
jgi:glycosyltransferase involved in cell wall biosynthesis